MKRLFLLIFAVLAACTPTETTPTAPSVAALKPLATVVIPPTPNRAERQATRLALPTTPTAPPPTSTLPPTAYIGVFVGTPGGIAQDAPPSANEALIGGAIGEPEVQCSLEADAAFGDGWRADPSVTRRLGCAIQQRFGFFGDVQVFERGVMYRRDETGEIWAVQPNRAGGAGQYWYNAALVAPPTVTGGTPAVVEGAPAAPDAEQPRVVTPISVPPLPDQTPSPGQAAPGISLAGTPLPPPAAGQRLPADPFSAFWNTRTEVSAGLGYASTDAQRVDINLQRFEEGTLFLDLTSAQVFILFNNGDLFGPYEPAAPAATPPPSPPTSSAPTPVQLNPLQPGTPLPSAPTAAVTLPLPTSVQLNTLEPVTPLPQAP